MKKTEETLPPEVLTSDTNNATTIPVEEAPQQKREKFRRFRAYNTGTWNGPKRENKDVTHRQDDFARYDALASSLNLTSYQKKRGRAVFDDLNFHLFGSCIDKIIFGVCAVVANEDVDDGTRYWPSRRPSDDAFNSVGKSLGWDWKEQMAVIKKAMCEIEL